MKEESKDLSIPGTDSEKQTVTKKTYLITIVIALVLISVVWIWKTLEISALNENADNEKQMLQQDASKKLLAAHEQHLKLLAKPFVWAIRSKMMQGEMSEVNLYMNEMVREKNFQKIVLINEKGTVVSSTNKKDEGKPYSAIGSDLDLANEHTNLAIKQDSIINLTSPVMGFNNRLGTLFIKYTVSKADFRNTAK